MHLDSPPLSTRRQPNSHWLAVRRDLLLDLLGKDVALPAFAVVLTLFANWNHAAVNCTDTQTMLAQVPLNYVFPQRSSKDKHQL